MKNPPPPIVALTTPGGHDLNKRESTLLKDASSGLWGFLVDYFLRRRVLEHFPYIFLSTSLTPIPLMPYLILGVMI